MVVQHWSDCVDNGRIRKTQLKYRLSSLSSPFTTIHSIKNSQLPRYKNQMIKFPTKVLTILSVNKTRFTSLREIFTHAAKSSLTQIQPACIQSKIHYSPHT